MKKLLLLFILIILTACSRDDSPNQPIEQPLAQDFTNPEFVIQKLQGRWILNFVISNSGTTNYNNGDYREFVSQNSMNVRTLEGTSVKIVNWNYSVIGKSKLVEFPVINSSSTNPSANQAFQITTLDETKLVLKSGTFTYQYTKN